MCEMRELREAMCCHNRGTAKHVERPKKDVACFQSCATRKKKKTLWTDTSTIQTALYANMYLFISLFSF